MIPGLRGDGVNARTPRRPEPLRARAAEMREPPARRSARGISRDIDRGLDEITHMSSRVNEQMAQWKRSMEGGVQPAGREEWGAGTAGGGGGPPAASRAAGRQQSRQSFSDVLARAGTVMKSTAAGGAARHHQQQQRRTHHQHAAPAPSPQDPPPRRVPKKTGVDPSMDKLRKFKQLLDQGLISKADYERQKELVLSEMGGVPSHEALMSVAAQRAKETSLATTQVHTAT
jgi:hypothetical protein